ncbi:MAG TPA: hypothetical protein VIG30_00410 [Ktedonobacterales bacterium]
MGQPPATRLPDPRADHPSRSRAGHHAPAAGWQLAFQTRAGQARGFLRFWPIWERIMLFFLPAQAIPGAPHGVLLIHLGRYHGRPIDLPDGTHIGRGDRIAELHMNNRVMASYTQAWRLARDFAADLRALAVWLDASDPAGDVRALFGLTILSRALPRFGFTLRRRRVSPIAWGDRLFMRGLLTLYSAGGLERLRQGTTYASGYPQEIWLSRGELRRRYGG